MQNHKSIINYQLNRTERKEINKDQATDFSLPTIKKVHQFQQTHPNYTNTPLVSLAHLASHLEVKNVFVKNEGKRFGLNAFKVLGGIYAIGKYIANQLDRSIETLSFEELQSEEIKNDLGELTFTSATDGNHGRGVAWAARELGHQAVIFLPKGASKQRVQAIQDEGARAVVTDLNYDGAVRVAAKKARENDWIILQDTEWDGYQTIPRWVMQGYASLAKEIIEQIVAHSITPPTHLFLQVGVGSYAASIAGYFAEAYKEDFPKIILVESELANCFYTSFEVGAEDYVTVGGAMNTIMAGLSCGEPNPHAWELLKQHTYMSFSVADEVAALGMRILGSPLEHDEQIISGESGAVPMGLLYCLMKDPRFTHMKETLDLHDDSQVILINTEGDTDEKHYKEIVWKGKNPYS